MPLFIVAFGILVLLILMMKFKVDAFVSLILVSIMVGIMEGMPLPTVAVSIEKGVGSTLGSLALLLGFGAMLGKLMTDCGGAQKIALTLINKLGKKRVQWAILLTGFIVGLAMFYEVGFVLLIPLVFTIAVEADLPILYVGIPMAISLSVTHGFLPPHPGATAIATVYGADLGKTLIYGIIIAIPTAIIAGPVFAKFIKSDKKVKDIPTHLFEVKDFKEEEMPGFITSVFTALAPVILMALNAVVKLTTLKDTVFAKFTGFFGEPTIALLVSLLIAIYTFGIRRNKKMSDIMTSAEGSIKTIAVIMLVIAGGGAFKQILIDSGVAGYIKILMSGSTISPLVMAWLIAVVIRLAVGSATVAGMTAAGMVLPILTSTHASPELMALATGAGSLIFSHLNDAGFWMVKEFFGLTVPETLKTWSVAETILSVCGLIGVLLVNIVVG
ncbi:gluconate:H+ symporter [Clostridium luticellarii]|jgi:Gnt-I system high-affinity gluconate transporter|uniref:High-affinity gluconate transporter n=1 Tax=Clostridium luticellarii TaxID=1691940 RepID=A0A2T0BMF3_9CLOT|nr:gluconate:H+ symporter [Clostridium luticellarii]MCI1944984.1 gluconate:H+ symporter [Clostridium luticellarii]MCI1967866.1 gluconate:H+ symporter [Clostridium luticellarii]MCI1995764.1 gluconate:H+ symporter [Clostridium luticellarii]MCI2040739.1 gluconate:H+ symporter [Clostridium luticellarii]PRR85056.1 High-affinity gluconate transporter [Clostridium luticellarii]